ncbi:MAG: glycerol-3-phosphate acyltransferase [Clostridiales bacterium]|nr:glycerol-3-phosphate acyltransferase [Clostridiales bacterium]
MNNIILLVVLGLASYFFGNINWAIIISKLKKQDIRKMGSGNPGTLNMSRNLGLKLGLLTFLLDILKGVIPSLIAVIVFKGRGYFENTEFALVDFASYMCGLFAVLGHIYPVIFKFKGGKGIATTIGVFIVCESMHGWEWSIVVIMALVAALIFIYLTEFGAMGSFIAITPPAIGGSIRLFLLYGSEEKLATCLAFYIVTNMIIFAICFFTWFAHRKNIKRMLEGDEHPTSIKEMVVKMKAKKAAERAEALARAQAELETNNEVQSSQSQEESKS